MIGRKDVGEVAFIDPVDLRGVDLDAVVDMDKGRIQVCRRKHSPIYTSNFG